MKIRSAVIILILLSITISGCTTNKTPEPDQNTIITSFTGHQASIKDYSGTVFLKTGNPNRVAERYKISVRYPGNYTVEYLESPGQHTGTIALLNSGAFLEYDPVNNTTVQSEVNPEGNSVTSHDYLGLLNRIIPEGNLSYLGVDYIDKKPLHVIEIRQEKPGTGFSQKYSEFSFSLVKVWVYPDTAMVKRIDLFDSDGTRLIASADYQELSINSGISDTVFDSGKYMQYRIITAPTHPYVVKYPGVEYPE